MGDLWAIKADKPLCLVKNPLVDKMGVHPHVAMHLKVATIVQPFLGQTEAGKQEYGYVEEGFQLLRVINGERPVLVNWINLCCWDIDGITIAICIG